MTKVKIPFVKMHGLGNDFVICDQRSHANLPTEPKALTTLAKQIADRQGGIGCDQFIIIEEAPSFLPHITASLRFFNADGSEAGACGNGTRCVAALLFDEVGEPCAPLHLLTLGGELTAHDRRNEQESGLIEVDMGMPVWDWQDIPLCCDMAVDHIPIALPEGLDKGEGAVAVSFGNPHAVFIVEDADQIAIDEIGSALEHHAFFPKRANIGFVSHLEPHRFRLRVWERGAGLTPACGSGACAAAAALLKRGIIDGTYTIELMTDGAFTYPTNGLQKGLQVRICQDTNHVFLAGATALSFSGIYEAEL